MRTGDLVHFQGQEVGRVVRLFDHYGMEIVEYCQRLGRDCDNHCRSRSRHHWAQRRALAVLGGELASIALALERCYLEPPKELGWWHLVQIAPP